jgi:hypothetical protein
MPTRLSKLLGVTREQLDARGIFDSTIDIDSRLYIDPVLFTKAQPLEFTGADKKITDYFDNVLRLVRQSKDKSDVLWRTALKKLNFGEGMHSGLGYSISGTRARGLDAVRLHKS